MTTEQRIQDLEERVAALEAYIESIEESSAEAVAEYDRERGI